MKRRWFASLVWLVLMAASVALGQPPAADSTVKAARLGATPNVHACGSLFFGGQPPAAELPAIQAQGIQLIISLRTEGEIDWDEAAAAKTAGIEFVNIPFGAADTLTDDVLGRVRELLRQSNQTPTLLHCGSANRVGAVWLAHRVLDQGAPLDAAVGEAKTIGLRSAEYEAKVRDYIARTAALTKRANLPKGINDNFRNADLKIEEWVGRFEIESREVFAARQEVVRQVGLKPGDHVADIGAGTGLFTRLFAAVVGDAGQVLAVDIAPRFLEHIQQRAREDGLTNVQTVLGSDDSTKLPPASIDVAFICDTYHHFEYPQATLASLHQALRPGGRLLVIDFERIPGQSREFILNHVRAGKADFRAEIEAAGFEFLAEIPLEQLRENYFLKFQKKAPATTQSNDR